MASTEEPFFRDLLAAIPELGELYQQHIEDNDGLLGYVALGNMTQELLLWNRGFDRSDRKLMRRFSKFLERAYQEYGDWVDDMIVQSYVEFVESLTVASPDTYPIVYRMLGPKLKGAVKTKPPKHGR